MTTPVPGLDPSSYPRPCLGHDAELAEDGVWLIRSSFLQEGKAPPYIARSTFHDVAPALSAGAELPEAPGHGPLKFSEQPLAHENRLREKDPRSRALLRQQHKVPHPNLLQIVLRRSQRSATPWTNPYL